MAESSCSAALLAGGVDTGWTFYPPYSTTFSNGNVALAVFGVFVAGFGTIATGVNFVATVHTLRAPGMTWFRMPLFVWAMYATSVIMILATPVLAITLLLVAADRLFGASSIGFSAAIRSSSSISSGSIPTPPSTS